MESEILQFIILNYLPAIRNATKDLTWSVPLFKQIFLYPHIIKSALYDSEKVVWDSDAPEILIRTWDDFKTLEIGTVVDYTLYQQANLRSTEPVRCSDRAIQYALDMYLEEALRKEVDNQIEYTDSRILKYMIVQDDIIEMRQKTADALGYAPIETFEDLYLFLSKEPWLLQYIGEFVYLQSNKLMLNYHPSTHRLMNPESAFKLVNQLPEYFSVLDWFVLTYWQYYGKSFFDIYKPTSTYKTLRGLNNSTTNESTSPINPENSEMEKEKQEKEVEDQNPTSHENAEVSEEIEVASDQNPTSEQKSSRLRKRNNK